jgi:hypothetical protein
VKERKACRDSIPFGYQATVFRLGAKAVPDKIVFRGDNAVWLAFIFSQAADEI